MTGLPFVSKGCWKTFTNMGKFTIMTLSVYDTDKKKE